MAKPWTQEDGAVPCTGPSLPECDGDSAGKLVHIYIYIYIYICVCVYAVPAAWLHGQCMGCPVVSGLYLKRGSQARRHGFVCSAKVQRC